ncbi:MAG: MBOAT family protein [Deltaproteobacteria bacterium]|nr:MBOAT family protein [Deltaproteobacteria bacterium]
MLFNSLYFLVFLALVLIVYHAALRSFAARKVFLLAASWLFYATWSPRFLVLLIATTWIDFQLARIIHRTRAVSPARARALLIASLCLNLGLLAYFKYGLFLYDSAGAVLALPPAPGFLAVVVPLGISFYTFHSISYVIDTYRGIRPPTDSFPDFALYVAFFPQLIAGPITRWGFFGPQLATQPHVGMARIEASLFLLAVGYVKKVVCADSLGSFVDGVYGNIGEHGWIELLVAIYAYAFQIYFDFSGYTDIAMGVAGLLGFRLPENFRHPYLAENPSEFWRRWHISLSTWLRDYLYVPLGGNRRGTARTYVNLLITMLLGGLWHGAAWTFVVWGGFHGLWLAAHRALSGRDWWRTGLGTGDAAAPEAPRTPRWLRRTATFHLVALAWVPFRAASLGDALAFFDGLASGRRLLHPLPVGPILLVLIGFATHGLATRLEIASWWRTVPRPVQGAAYGLVVILMALFHAQSGRFIYFQF